VGARRRFCRGLSEPGFETRLAEPRVIAGKECALAKVHAVVARVRVCEAVEEERSPQMMQLNVPEWDVLRDHPRFEAVVKRISPRQVQ